MRFLLLVLLSLSSGCATARVERGYADVNGLHVYYEITGSGPDLVLLHGGLCTIENCFGPLIPELARTHRVIVFEQQAHGRTADIDRKLTVSNMVGDTVAVLDRLGVKQADVYGYSMGAAVGLELALTHPERVKRLAIASGVFDPSGGQPGASEGLATLTPSMFKGTPWLTGYEQVAPHPEQFVRLLQRIQEVDDSKAQSPDAIRALPMPVLLVYGDADLVRPEHAVEFLRLLGGGVAGDLVPMPRSRLAIVPGTTHVTLIDRAAWVAPMLEDFFK